MIHARAHLTSISPEQLELLKKIAEEEKKKG